MSPVLMSGVGLTVSDASIACLFNIYSKYSATFIKLALNYVTQTSIYIFSCQTQKMYTIQFVISIYLFSNLSSNNNIPSVILPGGVWGAVANSKTKYGAREPVFSLYNKIFLIFSKICYLMEPMLQEGYVVRLVECWVNYLEDQGSILA